MQKVNNEMSDLILQRSLSLNYELTRCKDLVMGFNRLITTEEERSTNDYLMLNIELLEEEHDEYLNATCKIDVLDAISDIFVIWCQVQEYYFNHLKHTRTGKVIANYLKTRMKWKQPSWVQKEIDKGSRYLKWLDDENIVKAIKEVCRSNMTKIPTLEQVKELYGYGVTQDALNAACEWIEGQGRYKNVKGRVIEGDRVIFRCDNGEGKVVKWFGYEEPRLEELL